MTIVKLTGSPVANPMTASQDLIKGGTAGAPARLGVGTNGQVLTVSGGVVGWATPPAVGMANPMTSVGDLIVGGTAGAPSRLGRGSDGQVLKLSGGTPAWTTAPAIVLTPSGDATGATDDVNFNAACTALVAAGGGLIQLVGSALNPFYTANSALTYTSSGWAPPCQTVAGAGGQGEVSVQGIGGAVLMPVGAAKTGFYFHRTAGDETIPVGYIRDVTVDGSLATGASTGIDAGDGTRMHVRAFVRNFTGAGAIGFHQCNRAFHTEKCDFEVWCYSNTIAAMIDHIGGDSSHEYNTYSLAVYAGVVDQTGIQIKDVLRRCKLYVRGNMKWTSATGGAAPTGNAALLSLLGAGSGMDSSEIALYNEIFSGKGSNTAPWSFYTDGNVSASGVTACYGRIATSTGYSGINTNGQLFEFSGLIPTDQINNAGPPASGPIWPANNGVPAQSPGGTYTPSGTSGTITWQNQGPDALVFVIAAGATAFTVAGWSIGAKPGCIPVGAGQTITIAWGSSNPPTLTWTLAHRG